MSSSLTINSANAEKFASVVGAINMAMAKGKVSGNEWITITSTMPTVVKDIADYLAEIRGVSEVSEKEVRQMAINGELTTQIFIEAANRVRNVKNEMAEGMSTGTNDSIQRFTNELGGYLSELDKSTGATDKLVSTMNYLTDNMDGAAKLIGSVLAGALTAYTLKATGATLATVKSTYAKIADTIAESNAAKAEVARTATIVAQTRAQLGLTASQTQLTAATNAYAAAQARAAVASTAIRGFMSGGALGLVGLAVTLGTAAASWLLFKDNTELAKNALDDAAKSIDKVRQKIAEMTEAQLDKYIIEVEAAVKIKEDDVDNVIKQIKDKIPTQELIFSSPEGEVYNNNKEVIAAFENFKKLREESGDTAKAINMLKSELQELGVLDEKMNTQLTTLAGSLDDENKKLAKQAAVLDEAKSRKKELSAQNKEAAAASADLKNKSSELNQEIQKLTKSLDEQYQSGLGLDGAIASIESKITTLGGQSGDAAEEVAKLNDALDKLKGAKAKFDNLNDLKMLEDIKESARTMRMDEFDKKADKVQSSTLSDEQKKQAIDLIVQQKAYSDSKKTSKGSAKSGNDKENYLKNLEKEAAQLKLTTQEIKERELAEKNLSGEMLIRAKAALEIINADEKERQAMANANDNIQLQIELLRSLGDEAGAASLELKTRLTEMRKEFEKNGNTEGLSLLPKVERVNDFKIQMDSIKSEIDKLFNYQSQQEQSIQAQVTAGIITQYEAQKRLTELHEKTAKSVSGMLPQLQQMSKLEGEMGQQASDYLTQVQTRLIELQATTNELENAFRNGLQDGIQSSIDGLVRGTMNLQEALKNFVDSIASNILNVIAQQATDGIMGGLNSLNSMIGFGSDTAATTQATTQAAAASATASWTPAATAVSVASFGSAAMIGLSALMMVLTSMKAFATGGHVRGEGTSTSDSIPAMLSNGEFVTRAKVVKQPGMLDFMKDLNNRGWGAVNDLTRVHHSTGGLAGVPAPSAPSLPSINLAPMENTNSTTVKNNMMLNVIDDPNKVGNSLLNNEHTQDSFYVLLTENNQRVRQILQF